MSKVSDAKAKQNYIRSPKYGQCQTCDNFRSDKVVSKGWGGGSYTDEKNMRCSIGGFKVLKRGICDEHRNKVEG